MLARIILNLTLFTTLIIGLYMLVNHGIQAAMKASVITFLAGCLVSFVVGMIVGAREGIRN
jgi:hypothetical protein